MFFFHHSTEILKSYAKINVSLHLLGKLDNGYHELDMVFLPIDLHDSIELSFLPNSYDSFITCDDIGLANNRHNLCMKALNAMREEFHFKEQFNIVIHKNIPYAAGLGGGSSNAAAIILALNRVLHLNASKEQLEKIALTIGADVPYFFYNKPANVKGVGEIIEPFSLEQSYHVLIVKPSKGLSTKAIYEASDDFVFAHSNNQSTEKVIKALQEGNLDELSKAMSNDLYEPAKKILPDVEYVVNEMKKIGLPASMMTGSGSACFALSQNLKTIKEAAKIFEGKGYATFITHTLSSK